MLGLLVHRVFLQCVQLAFDRSSKQGQKNRKGAPPTGFDDLDAIEWGEINSKRMKRVQDFLADPFNHHIIIMYTIVMEPLAWLTGIIMAAAGKVKDSSRPTLLMDLTSSRYSPVWRILQ